MMCSPRIETVDDLNVVFEIAIDFDDHPFWDNGRGYFEAELYVLEDDGT